MKEQSTVNNRISFAQFDAILYDLGFQQSVIPRSHVTYRHPPTGALLLVRLHTPTDFVPDYVMVSTRHELDWRGVIDGTEFDARFQTAVA
jgi:predicted RNA binding protein YcfA (HicA-like mRNA interferase family)